MTCGIYSGSQTTTADHSLFEKTIGSEKLERICSAEVNFHEMLGHNHDLLM